MESAIALAVAATLLLLSGCVNEASPQNSAGAFGQAGNFSVPPATVAYKADYVVFDNGAELAKRVCRSDDRLRIDVGAQNETSFSLFFLGSEAYSCYSVQGAATCYNISSALSQTRMDDVMPRPDLSGAEETEPADIGGTVGRCYLVPQDPFKKRKMCFTDTGILAYDEYNVDESGKHIEYLSGLTYGVSDSDFILPASPGAMPQ